jgi:hypothetical protein
MKQFITEAQRLQKLAGIESDSDLIQNIIDLYIDLYDENSEELSKVIARYVPERFQYDSNLSYREMFGKLDQDTLEKLYKELVSMS